MKKVLEKLKDIFTGEYSGLVILFILEFIICFMVKPIRFDDAFFIEKFTSNTILEFVQYRYATWTSRVLIEATLGMIFKISRMVWVFGNSLMMLLIGYSISKIFVKDNKKQMNTMIFWLLLMYPIQRISGAGWAATSVNYIWPFATGLFSLISLKKMWDGEKIKFLPGLLYLLALIYSCNQELCCGVLTVTYILFAIILICRDGKKVNKLVFLEILMCILSLIFVLTTPGNAVRNVDETISYFPEFMSLSFLEKLSTGITATVGGLTGKYSVVFAVFTIMIMVAVCSNYKDIFVRVVSAIPFIATMAFSYGRAITGSNSVIETLRNRFIDESVLVRTSNYFYPGSYMNLIISLIVIVSIFVSLLLIFKKVKNNIAFYVFGCGLVTRLALAFSPTLFVSRERTFIIMELTCLICTLLIWQDFEKVADKKIKSRIYNLIVFLSIIEYIISINFVLLNQIGL